MSNKPVFLPPSPANRGPAVHGPAPPSDLRWAVPDAAPRDWAVSLMESLFVRAPVGMAVIDGEGHYVSVNAAYAALYGFAPPDMVGRSFTMVFELSQWAYVLDRHRRFLVDGEPLNGQWVVRRRDGATLHIESESVRVKDPQGRAHRLVYVVDFTRHKQLEQTLQATQQFLYGVLDGLTAHVCVLDEAGVIVAVNRAWREHAAAQGGIPERVHEGASYLAVCEQAALGGGAGCADAQAFLAGLRAVLAGARTRFQLEYPCHTPKESRWFLARVSRTLGEMPVRVVVAHDDVSALKQAQQTLRRSEALLLDMAASIPGALVRVELQPRAGQAPHWRFVYASPGVQTLYGISPSAACADPLVLLRCVLPEDRPAHDAAMQAAVDGGAPLDLEYRIRASDGRVKWVQLSAQPQRTPEGALAWTGVLTDVSERKHMESVLKASEETYRTLFETVPQGVVYRDTAGRITSANPAAQRILGLSLQQMQGMESTDAHWSAVREDGSELPGELHPAMVALRTGLPVHDTVMGVMRPGGERVWILINATPVYRHGRLDAVYTTFEDITQRVLMGQVLRRQASTDDLTGLANRRTMMARLAGEFERVQRHPELACSVLALDLDHFKDVNDTWGHATGDEVLKNVARLMQQQLRAPDLAARSGGEEFVVILPDTRLDEALALAERLRQSVQATPTVQGGDRVPLTLSIGVSDMLAADGHADAVLARADRALYRAKAAGRNAVVAQPAQG